MEKQNEDESFQQTENIKNNQIELKNIITEIKNMLEEITEN